jgi:hypothetical protein
VPKKRYRNPSILSISLLVFTLLFPTACGTLEVGVERTATPDQAATATVAALATENARLSAQATMLASTPTSTPFPATPTPTPGLGTVTGRICFPSERIPAMTAYFQNINTNQVIEMAVGENQPSYGIDLSAGDYIAYVWLPDFVMGGLYSEFVLCGLGADCTDHTPTPNGIDLCDWYAHPSQVPLPPGTAAPDFPDPPPPDLAPGLVTGAICYPSEKIPPMRLYFQDTTTNSIVDLSIEENQSSYEIQLPPGEYITYAWLPDFVAGGSYSPAVPCGLGVECTDHTPLPFRINAGQTTAGIDICDWYGRPGDVPLPPGAKG